MKRILHITPWYPESDDPHHGVFIARHVDALQQSGIPQTIVHLSIHFPGVKLRSYQDENVIHLHHTIPIKSWRLAELAAAFLLRKKLRQLNARKSFTHVCFHVAYPALVHLNVFKAWLPEKKLIIEHWSAYHFNFHSDHKPHRLKHLFHRGFRLATVSKRLGQDISIFCERNIQFDVLPNVVDTDTFCFQAGDDLMLRQRPGLKLMMHAFWKDPKKPFDVLHEIKEHHDNGISLVVSGSGPLWSSIKQFVHDHQLSGRVKLLENPSPADIAKYMREADVFLLPSAYETFSVVTAEALCCGCPVVVSDAGALPELILNGNGLVKDQSESWIGAARLLLNRDPDRSQIAFDASQKFSKKNIGQQFMHLLESI